MSAEFMKSKFARRPSVRPSVDYLWSYCMDFFQILVVASPGPYAQNFFNMGPYGKQHGTLWETTWDPIGDKIQNATPPSNHFWILLNFFWIFSSVVLTKVRFLIFENLSIWFFRIFFFVLANMGPYGSQTSKRYSSLKSLLSPFKHFLNFLLNGPHKGTVFGFLKFWVFDFWGFFFPFR